MGSSHRIHAVAADHSNDALELELYDLMRRFYGPVGLVLLLLLSGCKTSEPRRSAPEATAVTAGFDTWRYPGEEALQTWRTASPYEWIGYYLPAPCRRDSSWVGKRDAIEDLGWEMNVLFVGQQLFEGQSISKPAEGRRVICSRGLLTAEQGRRDAMKAVAAAREEGFPRGTTIYLDVERVSTVTDSLLTYYRSWTESVLSEGGYRPGTYAHRTNAAELFAEALDAYRAAGQGDTPPFWVAGSGGFALDVSPREVGLPFARIWQGTHDVQRSFGGVELLIDENVARP